MMARGRVVGLCCGFAVIGGAAACTAAESTSVITHVSKHPIVLVLMVAVAAPLLAEIPIGLRAPTVIFEVLLGIVIGPHVLGLARAEGFLATMGMVGMAASLFMAGMELDWQRIRGRPISLAVGGWALSLVLGVAAAGLLYLLPMVHAPVMVALALSTSALGTLLPVLRDAGQLETSFGRLIMAATTVGEVGPILVMSLLLSRRHTTEQQSGLLLVFLVITVLTAVAGLRAKTPKVLEVFSRTLRSSTQLPVRASLLMLGIFFVLSDALGFENILGAFTAGMIVGLATRGPTAQPFREKIDAVCFGWFTPFFFVMTGIKFDVGALTQSTAALLLVPAFLAIFLLVRGAPVLLYRGDLAKAERLPFALFCSVASVSLVIVITEIGTRAGSMRSDTATALIGAGMLSVLLFPTVGNVLLSRRPGAPCHPSPQVSRDLGAPSA